MSANRRIAAPRPAPTTQPPLLVESRDQLVYLITQACELEQGVLCEYLFALYSLKRDPQDGLASQQHAQVARWGRTLSKVAIQEMQHLALATNLLTALGAVPHLHRPNFAIRCQWYPPDVRLALVPFGEAALRHFMYLGTAGQMPEVFLDRPVPHAKNVTQARWDSTYCSRPSGFSPSKAEAIRTRTRSASSSSKKERTHARLSLGGIDVGIRILRGHRRRSGHRLALLV